MDDMCGIYKNLRPVGRRQSDGHMLYDAECSICGRTFRRAKSELKRCHVCKHDFKPTGILNKRIRNIFHGMKKRCYCETDKSYKIYGGKGVCIASEWLQDPSRFEQWSMSHGYADDLTIDRIDPDGNYEPQNCRWISSVDNAKYKSTTHMISVDGEEHTGRDWSKKCGLGITIINKYLTMYDEDQVVEFIGYVLANGLPERDRNNQSYIDSYLQATSVDFNNVTYASVAQSVEHLPSKQDVTGS